MPSPSSRRSLTAALWITLAALQSGCTTSAVAPTANAPGDDALVGDWMMAIKAELELPTRGLLHISKSSDGQLHVSQDDLSTPEKDEPLPLKNVTVDHGIVSIGETLHGSMDTDHNRIQGTFKVNGTLDRLLAHVLGDNTELPLVMTRVDPAHPPQRLQGHDYTVAGHHIHYLEVAGSTAARILFIHGSPGEADNWNPYLTDPALQQRATLIAVDRPGFGQSEPGQVITSLRDQARLLEPLLRGSPADAHIPTILVGWSEGGPIAAEMAMDYPDEVQAALLEAPAIDPEHDGAQWYNHAAAFWPIGKLVSGLMGEGFMWSNQEMMALQPQLKTMEPRWQALKMPIAVIQGEADDLVDPRTADFAQRVLPAKGWIVRVPGVGHGVPFTLTALAALNQTLTDLAGRQ